MVLDSSALIAILLDEPERRSFSEKLEIDPVRLVSAVSYAEAAHEIGLRRHGGDRALDLLLRRAGIRIVPVDADQADIAREALRLFGRGAQRAGLSFGASFAYALARATGEPLLYKGGEFGSTDVAAA